MKTTKKTERQKLVKRLDDVFSLYIRERDGYRCVVCGAKRPLHVIQCGHLFSRISHSTRWDELNAHAQCSGCNRYHEECFEPYRQVWVRLHSQEEYDLLYIKYRKTTKFTNADLRILIQEYRKKIKELKLKKAG